MRTIASVVVTTALITLAQAAGKAGTFDDGGHTKVSAMMMFLGNDKKVYILDKAENNEAQINGHPAWGSVWDIETRTATTMDIRTNTFCASGMHLPDGSYATFGGNGAAGPNPNGAASDQDEWGNNLYDETYQNYDGRDAIRTLTPCTDDTCAWSDTTTLKMQRKRWYSAAEPLADGTIAIMGGYVNGGYINRNYPNEDPAKSGGASEPSTEFFPANGREPRDMQFMIDTSGLNSYAHTYLMRSGKMLVQANYSTALWTPETNAEERLPDMPNQIIRVYPGSGGVAMLPLRPTNGYNPTLLFCGGQGQMNERDWGDFAYPYVNTWELDASKDCQRLTPEPLDATPVAYEQDDDMPEGRTMGQLLALPDGKYLMVNGAAKGTAGYSTRTLVTENFADMPFGQSLAGVPTLKPAIYDPDAPLGKRWSNKGLESATFPRLYHSVAILLPDASVLIAGSNPGLDVDMDAVFPTTYQAEIFYPPYFSAKVRPAPKGVPASYTYGGASFDITIPASSYSGPSDAAAKSAQVNLVRTGWTTHGMNMGQRFLQLDNSYTVKSDGSITLHVSQPPPMPEVLQPGPVFTYVVINGVPSVGVYAIVGSGQVEKQTLLPVDALPASKGDATATGSASAKDTNDGGNLAAGAKDGEEKLDIKMIAIIAGAAVVVIILIIVAVVFIRRRRSASSTTTAPTTGSSSWNKTEEGMGQPGAGYPVNSNRDTQASGFAPLQQDDRSQVWGSAPMGGYKDYDSDRQSNASSEYYAQQHAQGQYGQPPMQGQYAQQPQGQYQQEQYNYAQGQQQHHPQAQPPYQQQGGGYAH